MAPELPTDDAALSSPSPRFSPWRVWLWELRLLIFSVPAPKPPAMQPWGLRIAYVVDPSGLLWHIAQRRAGIRHDE